MSAPALPRNHDDYEALAVAWAINALEPAEQALFEEHRAGCEDCTRIACETLDVAAELAYGVPDVAPPRSLRDRLLTDAAAIRPRRNAPGERLPAASGSGEDRRSAAVVPPETRSAATRGVPAPTGRRHSTDDPRQQEASDPSQHEGAEPDHHGASGMRPGRRRPGGAPRPGGGRWLQGRRRVLAAAVAAVLVGGSAVTTWQIVRADQAAPADRVAALSAGGGTVATVVEHERGADVVTDSLPPNEGTAYYVWGVPAGGDPQVVGTFEVTAAGLHSYPLRLVRSLSGYPVLAVSEEPAGSTPTAPSSVIGKGSLGG